MFNNYGLTTEEMLWRKKRNRYILYTSIFVITIIISAIVTIMVNQI